ncbi:MAG: 30S ribosomal protein S4 [Candidatus Moranbacteria bacterium CG23_combo_of_CG06-09_8_20_14_all_39_10]|nr:MAG: 30S ribosomal protein S4 [Candidatus Moranbacteria bacterium CG23_combo_of_CG06-09_8_20_14_all_39_10]
MARDTDAKCRKCRRSGEKLFLKGERCDTAKCGMVKRAYAPGVHGKKVSRGQSEYGIQLSAKQKIKRIYGVLERQFKKHFDEVVKKPGITGDLLLARLEMRLDTIVYRSGFSASRTQARQLVNHGLMTVNGKKVSIPSYEVKVGDVISIGKTKSEKSYFKNLELAIKNKKDFPAWISFDVSKMEAKVTNIPTREEIGINVDVQVVVEYYSR